MRILFINDFPLWGSGSATYLRHLVQELLKLNYKIGIIAPEERRFLPDKIKQYKIDLPQIPVFVGHPELKGAKRYSELSNREITEIYKAYIDTTLEAVDNFQPDLIHVNHLSLISWVARYINALTGIKYTITTHGSCLSNILENKKYLPLCRDAVRGAKAITTPSGDVRSRFRKAFGKEFDKNLYVIPGGVDIKQFPQKIDTSALEKKYNLKGKKVVFFSGRLTSEKGIKYLIRAAKDIEGEIFIAGEGPESTHIKSYIKRNKLENVHLLGYLPPEELIDFYYRADVFVAPSVAEEALGLSILEAMAARTPVIATRKGGIPLLVKHGYNGFFVKHGNSSKIAQACNRILKDKKLRERMGNNARKTVEEKFTWEKTAKKFHRLFKKNGNGKNNRSKG